jgi:hypothetical protein
MLVGFILFISSLVYFAFLKDVERAGLQYKILKPIQMNTGALITMVLTQGIVTSFAVYFL